MSNPPILCLASASPRRQELLEQSGIVFVVQPSDVSEKRLPGESPRTSVLRLAREKATWVWMCRAKKGEDALPVLGADTAVVLGDHMLGKPENRADALKMLERLSGRTHDVLSSIALVKDDVVFTALNTTRVSFAVLERTRISDYLDTGEADDKAGSYGIQGMAAGFISRIEGSYSGVMGLPLYELDELMKRSGWFKG